MARGCFAHVGAQVTCENGHPICTVAEDLFKGATIAASQFKDWKIDIDATPGMLIPECPCGAPFISHRGDKFPKGGKIFIDGAWRP